MIYLDHGATSFPKPPAVRQAVETALRCYGNPGRGGHFAAAAAQECVYACREKAAHFFDCEPEQVVFTGNCTQGLNMAISSITKPSGRVLVTGFEHNAVMRTLHGLGRRPVVAGRRLFCWEDTLENWEKGLQSGVSSAVFTHVSNVFGYELPVEEMCALCRRYGVPFVVDAAQSAGVLPVRLKEWGASYIAMPGHKGLLGPQGTGMLLCAESPKPLVYGGTGSQSALMDMPDYLPDSGEAGTVNVPGIAGLYAGLSLLEKEGVSRVYDREHRELLHCANGLEKLGLTVFSGENQVATVSFLGDKDCEEIANRLAQRGIAVRSGLHCAPLAHESAGTLTTGTVRVSFGHDASPQKTRRFLAELSQVI